MTTQVLTEDQIERLSRASLEILERVGVVVPHEDALRRFADAGADVDFGTQLVRIPPELVLRLVAGAGKQFTIYGRDVSKKAEFGVGKRNYNSIAGEALWVDSPGGDRRYATMADVASAAKVGDALDCINIVSAMADPIETPVAYRCVEVMAELIRNSTKPITFWFHDRSSAKFINEISIALRGSEKAAEDHPICYPFLEPISPLRFPYHGIDLLFVTAELNLPVPIGPMAQMGLSAPATVAGTLAQENAEILAGICITQLIRPGAPVLFGGAPAEFHMRAATSPMLGIQALRLDVAYAAIGKALGLPTQSYMALSDSKFLDAQAGAETFGSALLS